MAVRGGLSPPQGTIDESNRLLSQSRHFKHTSQDSINKLIIWNTSPLVVPSNSVKFKSAFYMRKEKWIFQGNFRMSLFEQIYNNFKGIKFTSKSGQLSRQKFHHWLACEFTVCKIAEINVKSEIEISYSLELAQHRKILKRSPSIYQPLRF